MGDLPVAGDVEIAVYGAQREQEAELDRATAAFEHAVLSPLFLLNGGAAAAFLTLLGASSEGSALGIDAAVGLAAVAAWSAGLAVAAVAAHQGHQAQRLFTRAVRARRLLLEHAIVPQDSPLAGALTPLDGDPREHRASAGRPQERYQALIGAGIGLFLLGVLLAGASVAGA